MVGQLYRYDGGSWKSPGRNPLTQAIDYDWSDSNLPWAYTDSSEWESRIPDGLTVADLQTGGSDFYTNLNNTVNAASGRVLVKLPVGDHVLTSFRMIGSSGDPTYSMGYWNPKLAGFVGEGADQTFISLAANSTVLDTNGTTDRTTDALTKLSQMTQASFATQQMSVFRLDTVYNSTAVPIFLGGLTVRAAAQRSLTSISSDITAGGAPTVPQSMPHQGVFIYGGGVSHPDSVVSHCRFQGAGKAWTSQPPFEMANYCSQKNQVTIYNTESDGRMSDAYDSSRPLKCGVYMINGEISSVLQDSWLHHTNTSRYAANDESVVSGTALTNHYVAIRSKIEQIAATQNDGHGGWSPASCMGWESSNALIELTDCILSQDDPYTSSGVSAHHASLTVTTTDRSGGRFKVIGGSYRNSAFPTVDGYFCLRIAPSSCHWYADGVANTVAIKDSNGNNKTAHVYTGTWPPSASYLSSNNLSPDTHYLIKPGG